jgi:hypothetical protein
MMTVFKYNEPIANKIANNIEGKMTFVCMKCGVVWEAGNDFVSVKNDLDNNTTTFKCNCPVCNKISTATFKWSLCE